MKKDSRLMHMLTGYAAAHQHPVNIALHMLGIPVIMFGVFVVFSWARFEVAGITINAAYLTAIGLALYYFTLDKICSLTFLLLALPVAWFASVIGAAPIATSGTIAAATFFGGYAAQFVGHAVEKSVPVVLKHPVQANVAAPFFTVVELFKFAGLRDSLFDEVQQRIMVLRHQQNA